MIKIATLTLENEMDLILAHKRSMKVAERLGLTVATQTTVATAVSEVARTVIEHTDNGVLEIGLEQNKQRYALIASIKFDSDVRLNADEGFYYAQKLVPEFSHTENGGANVIEMKLGLPRSLKLDPAKISVLKRYFADEGPLNAYEEIKLRNLTLKSLAEEQEEALRRSQLIDQQKTEFISVASHELKTPITILKAYTQMARSIANDNYRLKDALEKVDTQTSKLAKLVQQMLDVSKLENGRLQYEFAEFTLNGFISDTVAMMALILPDHVIQLSLGADIMVRCDRSKMEQVFSNLLGNAAKYSQKKTTISISSFVDAGFVTVVVKDQGIGLSPKSRQSVFDKFYRDQGVKQSHPGLGMGLYITSKIINDHGGKIWVDSEEGVGSSFSFTVPVCAGVN